MENTINHSTNFFTIDIDNLATLQDFSIYIQKLRKSSLSHKEKSELFAMATKLRDTKHPVINTKSIKDRAKEMEQQAEQRRENNFVKMEQQAKIEAANQKQPKYRTLAEFKAWQKKNFNVA